MKQRAGWMWAGAVTALVGLLLGVVVANPAGGPAPPRVVRTASLPAPTNCSTSANNDATLRYVAGGDAVVNGTDLGGSTSQRYSDVLTANKLQQPPTPGPWCLFNISADPTNTDTFVSGGQQGQTNDLGPQLITLTLGRQNDGIKEQITTCLQNIKDHDFISANACALAVLADSSAWDKLAKDLDEVINRFKVMTDANPGLIVAVTDYFNPYPSATSVATDIPGFCADLVDTIATCVARWILLPPALVTLDQVVKKLNSTIQAVVHEFTVASQGRIVFVDLYDKFKDHCTKMDVSIKTTVYHPPSTVDEHDSEKDFGCSTPWIASDGNDGTLTPFPYLTPAADGVLTLATQTTSGMGVNPNDKGHDCIADLIWEAVKQKLGVAQAPDNNPCSADQ